PASTREVEVGVGDEEPVWTARIHRHPLLVQEMSETILARRDDWIGERDATVVRSGDRDGAEGSSRSASLEQRGVVEGTPACAADDRVADENVKGAETGVQKAFINECLAPVGRTGDSIEAEAASTKEDALGKTSGIVEPDND